MSAFLAAFERVIGHEGGLSMDPNDRGNWTGGAKGVGQLKGTKYGIASHVYPQLDIPHLTLEDAQDIYYRDYWVKAGCNLVPAEVGFDLFDFAVNSGPATAVKCLQWAVGADPDGVIGPKTLAAIQKHDSRALRARLYGARLEYLTTLPTWPAHGKGWVRRAAANLKEIT